MVYIISICEEHFHKFTFKLFFAVKGKSNLIFPSFEEEVYKYISGIVTGKGQKSLAINGMPDHNSHGGRLLSIFLF